ncbi:hypothetical protein GCM10009124_19260 [Shewanella xiamenensis]|nr:hypothetical protein GCM10009124_19260 [Shewanella xiamenensis]
MAAAVVTKPIVDSKAAAVRIPFIVLSLRVVDNILFFDTGYLFADVVPMFQTTDREIIR